MASLLTKHQMAARLVQDIPDGSYVNLGIGLPTLVGNNLDPSKEIVLHSENGALGGGGPPGPGDEDPDFVDAGKAPFRLLRGGSLFDSAVSFAMMRSGALDLAVLGAFQTSVAGDLANWKVSDSDAIPAVGGAMDLATGARDVYVLMSLFDKVGRCKLVPECTFPLTAVGCVSRVYTEYAVIELHDGRAHAVELFGDTSLAELSAWTGIGIEP